MAPYLYLTGLMVTAYLLGAIPWGLLLTRKFRGRDIRQTGSGNIGATNVARVAGKALGALTLLLDGMKGGLPVGLAWMLAPHMAPLPREMGMSLAALSAVLGHSYPVYLGFKTGGKGVATAAGCFLLISPGALAASFFVFGLVFLGFRRVSAASLAAIALLPGFISLQEGPVYFTVTAVLVAALVFIRHKDNIRRLLNGTEPVFGKKP